MLNDKSVEAFLSDHEHRQIGGGQSGEIVICDWQGVNAGGASGDISFFISRLGADGTEIAPEKLVEIYEIGRASCRERV